MTQRLNIHTEGLRLHREIPVGLPICTKHRQQLSVAGPYLDHVVTASGDATSRKRTDFYGTDALGMSPPAVHLHHFLGETGRQLRRLKRSCLFRHAGRNVRRDLQVLHLVRFPLTFRRGWNDIPRRQHRREIPHPEFATFVARIHQETFAVRFAQRCEATHRGGMFQRMRVDESNKNLVIVLMPRSKGNHPDRNISTSICGRQQRKRLNESKR
mmetsp:Transcript_1986/g.5649  ORF Transcript_1986/g.5649 Transcript_1986/m.5649 type:complete len:213 (-) Transcript_1986:2799-3437(-)